MKAYLAVALAIGCTAAVARAEVVNIDARVNGTPFSGFPQVLVPVTAGHYRATLVNPSIDNAALFTAWCYGPVAGCWLTAYRFRLADGSLIYGGEAPDATDAQSAFDATVEKVLEFDVPTDQTLEFHVADNVIDDNDGGVSLDLTVVDSSTSSTSTSTSTTTAPPTTTTLPGGCGGIPDGATFSSLVCRVQALRDRAAGESGLGAFGPKLVHSLETALDRLGDARTRCGESNSKKARKRLQQAGKALTQYAHRLRGLPARKKLDDALRQDFLAAGQAIAPDVATLRGAVACPGDAAS